MNYVIYTPSAERLKKEIVDSTLAKVDSSGQEVALYCNGQTMGFSKPIDIPERHLYPK